MNTIIKRVIIGLALAMPLAASQCENNSAEERRKVEAQQDIYSVAQPIPQFSWSLERNIVIQLYAARNTEVATHTVWRSDFGMIEGDCPSIGYPVPYDTSLTNPLMRAYMGSGAVIEQPEPNGIFASKNSIATWVRCTVEIDGVPKQAPIYIESRVTAYPYPVIVDYENDRAIKSGDPSLTIEGRN